MLAVWALLALQGGATPDVTAHLDRAHVAAGDQVLVTIRARTRSAEPLTLTLPALTGFTLVGSREVTEVTLESVGGRVRTTTRELELRAQRPGTLVIGPVHVHQGRREVATPALTVTVDSTAPGLATTVSPVARRLIDAAPPPARTDQVQLTVIVAGDSILVGQQLDVIAAAWFPRELRLRLRRPPILTLQTPEGVWAYPGAAPSDVAASRLVRGRWLDLFVAHEAVFPLTPGRIVIPPATLDYALPASFAFFSREDRYALRSDPQPVTVLPLPGAPGAADPAAVAQGLALELGVEPANGRVGEPIAVTAAVTGIGNVALWPELAIRWPAGFRVYPGETGTRITARDGRIGGTKTFHYLVMPDSAGSFELAAVRYPYHDLATGDVVAVTLASRPLAVAAGTEPRAARALPPLAPGAGTIWTDELARDLVPWGWLALLVGPPLIAWLWRRRDGVEPVRAAEPAAVRLTRIGRLEHEFDAVLASHVPDPVARDGDGLGRALRAAGVETAVADHVTRLRDRLRAARYGPRGIGDATELATEIERVLRALGADPAGTGRRIVVAGMLVALAALPLRASRAPLQAPSAEALYDAGALRAAADSFAARATRQPRVPAHWYNLGATLYRAGADGKATAAWAIAARLAPRDPLVWRARELLPTPDAPSEPLLAVGPLTPGEGALVAALGWVAVWLAVATRRRRATLLTLALLTTAAAALATREALRQARPVVIMVNPTTPVRVAPYGSASPAATVAGGAALTVERVYGPWLELRRDDGVRGWVLATEVQRL